MAEIIKTYRQSMAATRFIGKKYTNSDRIDGGFGVKWDEWHTNGWFDVIEKQVSGSMMGICEDGNAQVALMCAENGDFAYRIGYFTPENTPVPEGYEHIDFPKSELGICWVYGKEHEVFMLEGQCGERLKADGFEVSDDWCLERYVCPRFTTPDEKGNITLDICFFLK